MSLLATLPAPRQQSYPGPVAPAAPKSTSTAIVTKEPPRYPKRQGWVPRRPEDFGDGGAYPEIHVAQYPLGMGEDASRGNRTLAVSVNADGDVSYDAILRQGANKHKTVIHSDHKALVPKLDLMDAKVRTLCLPQVCHQLCLEADALGVPCGNEQWSLELSQAPLQLYHNLAWSISASFVCMNLKR